MAPPPDHPTRLPDLPVRDVLSDLDAALTTHGTAVLVAPPGAGKTTLVPLALLDRPDLHGRKILVLEPRRLAARAAARRMAELLGEDDVGGTVGYRVRLDTRVSAKTRIEVVTEGILTRMLQSDPALDEVGVVIFDEFHERSLHADLGLALALQSRALLRPDLKLVVMSATLDPGPVAELLGSTSGAAPSTKDAPSASSPAPVVESRGRMYPVDTRFRSRPVSGWIEPPVADTIVDALAEEEGDVLVFLPGAAEIRRTAERLEDRLPQNTSVHQLFGALPRAEQDRAIRPSPAGRRKVVLATSIAETSLTIEGVRVVVDSGRMRIPRFDPGSGMTRLETVRVTRDSADQRRGRAGRTEPGVCYRLWTEGEDHGLVPARAPEIVDADLTPLALELATWGADPDDLGWLTEPPEAALAQARELLYELDAVDADGVVTDHGRAMAGIGAHPRLAHLLIRGREENLGGLAADLAALLNNRDILRGKGRAPDADLRLRVEALQRARRGRSNGGGTRHVLREADHWRRGVRSGGSGSGGSRSADAARDVGAVGSLLALAYPDRVGRRREGERGRFLLRNGRGAALDDTQSLADSDWIVAADLDGRGRDGRIYRAAPIDLEEVERRFCHQIHEEEEVAWDSDSGRVRGFRRRRLGALILSESAIHSPSREALTSALLDGIRDTGVDALPWTKETTQLRERLTFLHRLKPDDWPDAGDHALLARLENWLAPFLGQARSLEDLKRLDLEQILLTWVGWDRRDALERLAPTHVEVPSGSRIRLDYSKPEAPVLAVRLQEVFGLMETPRIGGGAVRLTLHLLSPARRPVQVTQDLASFWRDAYFEVRKDMRGRYPKHYWPEDPLEAEATRRTRPR